MTDGRRADYRARDKDYKMKVFKQDTPEGAIACTARELTFNHEAGTVDVHYCTHGSYGIVVEWVTTVPITDLKTVVTGKPTMERL